MEEKDHNGGPTCSPQLLPLLGDPLKTIKRDGKDNLERSFPNL